MAFCKACGQDIGDAAFCPKCGAAQGAATPAAAAVGSSDSPTAGIDENVAGLLCYLFHWLSGLIFLLLDKRPFVRFHAAQAIAFNIAAAGGWVLVAMFSWFLVLLRLGLLIYPVWGVFGAVVFATWIFLMYKAYQREKFKLPIIGDIVEKMVGQ